MAENICTKKLFRIMGAIEEAVSPLLEKELVYWNKDDGTPVSNVDIVMQQAISAIILKNYPDDHLIFEEGTPHISVHRNQYSWVIDPIDGTENFINKRIEFSICIGLMSQNQFVEAFLIFPKLNETYYASRGNGILRNGKEFQPEPAGDNAHKEVILCSKTLQSLSPFFESRGYPVGFYKCATYSLLLLLKGKALLYHTINTMIYDIGPMAFILSEMGIKSYDREKAEISFDRDNAKIPFFLSMIGVEIPENIYQGLFLQ